MKAIYGGFLNLLIVFTQPANRKDRRQQAAIGMVVRTVICASLLAFATAAQAGPLQREVITVSEKYVGQVVERTNRNDHPMIDKWLGYLGLPKGLSWCAAFVVGMYKEAADSIGIKQPLPRYGRVATLWDYARANQMRFQTFRPDEAMMIGLLPGDLAVWRRGRGVARNFDGHIGIVKQQLTASTRVDREGNTVPGNTGGQREQKAGDRNRGGVYDRTRGMGFGTSFSVEGFIRVRS